MTVDVDKHPDAPNFKELTVTLSDNLSLVKSRFGSGGERRVPATWSTSASGRSR